MLKFKLTDVVPEVAVNAGYVKGYTLSPRRDISLIDYASTIPENSLDVTGDRATLSAIGTGGTVAYLPHAMLSSQAVVPSFKSKTSEEVRNPIPLYYIHKLGKAGNQIRASRDLCAVINSIQYSTDSDGIYQTSDADRSKIRNSVSVVDSFGNPANIEWDVWVATDEPSNGVYQTETEAIGVFLNVYFKELPRQSYFIKYTGYRLSNGEVLPNHTECVNPQPQPMVEDYTYREWESYTSQPRYPILTRAENCPGFYLAGHSLDSTNIPNTPGLTIAGHSYQLDLSGDPYTLVYGGTTYNLTAGDTDSITTLCAEINGLGLEDVKAIPNSVYHQCHGLDQSLVDKSGSSTYEETVVPLYNSGTPAFAGLHYRHRPDRLIRVLRPVESPPYTKWYPRIQAGEFTVLQTADRAASYPNTRSYLELHYAIPEYFNNQDWSTNYGAGVREVIDEVPTLLSSSSVEVKRRPIYSADSVKVFREGEEVAIKDVDLNNGIIFFSADLSEVEELTVNYAHTEPTYTYKDLDLNPITNPSIAGQLVGIYILPQTIVDTTGSMDASTSHGIRQWTGSSQTLKYGTNTNRYQVNPSTASLSDLELYGVTAGYHTDNRCRIYASVSKTGSNYTVLLYSDSARSELVASYYGTGTGWILFEEENSSGVTGRGKLTYSSDENLVIDYIDVRRTVGHVTGDTISDIQTQLSSIETYTFDGSAVATAKLLAVVQINPGLQPDEIDTVDSRTRGGGIKDHVDIYQEEARMNYDIGYWDGEPFQSAASVVIHLPEATGVPVTGSQYNPSGWLDDYVGNMTTEEVETEVKEFIAAGVYPLIDYIPAVETGTTTGTPPAPSETDPFLEDFEDGWT